MQNCTSCELIATAVVSIYQKVGNQPQGRGWAVGSSKQAAVAHIDDKVMLVLTVLLENIGSCHLCGC